MEMNSYYQILGLKYDYKPIRLILNYLKNAKTSLNSNTPDDFIKVRQGFEVLREEKSAECYNRIFKKYVLNQKLNYPKLREQEMIQIFQEKERNAKNIAGEIIQRKESYSTHLSKIVIELMLFDISRILLWGSSGLLFISVGLWAMLKFQNEANIIGGSTAILLGLFFLRRNIKYYVIS